MDHRDRTARTLRAALLGLVLSTGADPAFADLTVFAGRMAPAGGTTGGVSLGISLRPVGMEFEYAGTTANRTATRPALQTGLFNLLVSAPLRSDDGIRIYVLVGGGAYRERFDEHTRTGLAVNAGGGITVSLAGPFRVRVDYRLFALRGGLFHRRPRRVYTGLDLAF